MYHLGPIPLLAALLSLLPPASLAARCPQPADGYEARSGSSTSWYKHFGSGASHGDAEAQCQLDGGHLAYFRNSVEFDDMKYYADKWAKLNNVWLGLKNPNLERCNGASGCAGKLRWSDGSTFQAPGSWFDLTIENIVLPAGKKCLRLGNLHLLIKDFLCGTNFEYLCQYECPPVHGGWSGWSEGPCSAGCGPGVLTKTRTCTDPAPDLGGDDCDTNPVGDTEDNVACNLGACPVVNGGWSDWSSGPCSTTCGSGVLTKTRTCTNPVPVGEGLDCATSPVGDTEDNVACNLGACPVVNGGWSEWSSGPCSTTCGPGFVNKTRTCTNPAPVGEGLDCATNPFGDRLDNVACNVQDCPRPPTFEAWTVTSTNGANNTNKTEAPRFCYDVCNGDCSEEQQCFGMAVKEERDDITCRCSKSSTERYPGTYCGPMRLPCNNRNSPETPWIDGLNTAVPTKGGNAIGSG